MVMSLLPFSRSERNDLEISVAAATSPMERPRSLRTARSLLPRSGLVVGAATSAKDAESQEHFAGFASRNGHVTQHCGILRDDDCAPSVCRGGRPERLA